MNFIEVPTYRELSERAANILIQCVNDKPACVLGLVCGLTPVGAYLWLSDGNRRGKVDFSSVTAINLNESEDDSAEHKQAHRRFMEERLYKHINIKQENTRLFGLSQKPQKEGYAERLEKVGGIDLLLLSVKADGGLGFPLPEEAFSKIREVMQKGLHTAGDPTEPLPPGALSILYAKRILLLAKGQGKRALLDKAFGETVDPRLPASLLQLHPEVTVIFSPQ